MQLLTEIFSKFHELQTAERRANQLRNRLGQDTETTR